MYCYKIRVSINKDFPQYQEKLEKILKSWELVPLGDNEYGIDDFEKSRACVSYLGSQDWFLDYAKELIWCNGDDFEETGRYYEMNSLKYYLRQRAGGEH